MDIKKFITTLANTPAPKHAVNPWDYSKPTNSIRRNNLEQYLRKMRSLGPTVLLVGEAPGYRGCGKVGMPFSSERLVQAHPFFSEGFLIENPEETIAEASASIVWKTFDSLNFYPVMWATYPFHPHKPGDTCTNRAPRPEEVLLGKQFLEQFMQLFPTSKVIAVGRVAEKSLADMGIEAIAVRHPSHGGATLFAEGIAAFLKR
jgi:uracil-DNA glycosylase